MKELAGRAWSERESFDLSGIGYGQPHWGNTNQPVVAPHPYYFFLAGLVKITGARKIVEVGTHQGGSARAMAKAFPGPTAGKILTFDITPYGSQMFAGHPAIRAYNCDANSEAGFNHVIEQFGEPRIDLVFIDGMHDFWFTLMSVLIYGEICAARYIVLDDISLNPEMEKLWALLRSRYGTKNVIDATQVDETIRRPGVIAPGFGVIRSVPAENSWDNKWPDIGLRSLRGLPRIKRRLKPKRAR
ncbi:MAG TPA: class I SAM-dependent methyltransferase [Verrucomicrobiae bacterium]|jgi:hypothetical protein